MLSANYKTMVRFPSGVPWQVDLKRVSRYTTVGCVKHPVQETMDEKHIENEASETSNSPVLQTGGERVEWQ